MASSLRTRGRGQLDRWLFRLSGPEPGEVFLHQRRVFILPTRAGIGFAAMLVLLFIGSINYNLNLGFAFTFLVAACAVIDMHLTFRNLAHLHLAPGRAAPVFCGETAHFELNLINRRKHDRYAIWLDVAGQPEATVAQPADVAGDSSTRILLGLATHQRGLLAAPRLRLVTRFPLGLLRAWSYWQPDTQALVYPRPEDVGQPLPTATDAAEGGAGGPGFDDFAGIRAYQSGDAMRHLAWRQIARVDLTEGGALVTKQFDSGSVGKLVLDFDALPARMDLELKISRLTRWVLDAEARTLPYAFRLGSLTLPAGCGAAHQQACLQALALYPAP